MMSVVPQEMRALAFWISAEAVDFGRQRRPGVHGLALSFIEPVFLQCRVLFYLVWAFDALLP
jgi:hypothetical protein